ncbi:leucine-rich repeat domain-containing protein [Aquimarina rubra]|uniref:Immunoglobulin domain-containing protein n=1 Tax=Aquimarina rubra TaxID=1920033 RepID=A0ABW5L8M3_9FLAO
MKNSNRYTSSITIFLFLIVGIHNMWAQVSQAERDALIDLYNSTNGDNWTNTVAGDRVWQINDPNSDVSTWYGVILGNNGHISSINLGFNNLNGVIPASLSSLKQFSSILILALQGNKLTGNIPPELGELSSLVNLVLFENDLSGSIPMELVQLNKLVILWLSNNNFSGDIPNFSVLPDLGLMIIDNNRFVFSDFEDEFNSYRLTTNNGFQYISQAKVDTEETLSVTEGGSITLTSNVLTSDNNNYQWYKDGVAIANETNKDLVISNAVNTDAGEYMFRATNSVVINLELERNPITLTVTANADCVSAAERQALVDLYNATNGDQWKNTVGGNQPWLVNDPNSSVCDWFGIVVVDGKVTQLKLPINNLSGSIPSSISQLSGLRDLRLGSNNFSGTTLPNEIGELTELRILGINNCKFEGPFPIQFTGLSELTFLNAEKNNFTGTLPIEINKLKKLEVLELNQNQLSGAIPFEIGALESLTYLRMFSNQFTGQLPTSLGDLSNLVMLNLGGNSFTSKLPEEIGKLKKLKYLVLNNCGLYGNIPAKIGEMSSLITMSMYNNQFEGSIPVEFEQLKNSIENIILQGNQLSGNIPDELGQLENLKILNLNSNQFTGSIPVSLGELTNLKELRIEVNQLEGRIPDFAALSGLTNLRIQQNKFIFSDFETEFDGYVSKLGSNFKYSPQAKVDEEETRDVSIGEGPITLSSDQLISPNNSYQWYKTVNNITTAIPDATSKEYIIADVDESDAGVYHFLATNSVITDLELRRNPVTVSISNDCVSAQERQALIDFYVALDGANWINTRQNNQPWLINDPNSSVCDWFGVTVVDGKVTELRLENNNLVGALPNEITGLVHLQTIWLAKNKLSGNIPAVLGQMNTLTTIRLNQNEFSGSVPPELGGLNNLTGLFLYSNQLTGTIPVELSELSSLLYLNLSYNQLTGTIPLELSQLKNTLQQLHLMHNQLTGTIPKELGLLSRLVILNLNSNRLTGSIPKELGDLSGLTQLWLDVNELSGTIPPELGALTKINSLKLNTNQLSEGIPIELTNLKQARVFYLFDNQLTGPIHPEFGAMRELRYFDISKNQLDGSIPTSFGNLTNAKFIDISVNKLTGAIPSEIGQLSTALQFFSANNNQLEGSIPPSFMNLEKLIKLNLGRNQLSGKIPDLSGISTLTALYIQYNEFIFSDFETEFVKYKTQLETFQYSPQAKVDTAEARSVSIGEGPIILSSNQLTSENNSYQWYKKVGETATPIADATSKDFVITEVKEEDAGAYYFLASNSIITNPDLILERNPITLVIGTTGGDCTNLLETIGVDTSFETAISVVTDGRNESLGDTGWTVGQGTPDTFLPPLTNTTDDLFLEYNFQNSPNGGVCAGGLRANDQTESFGTELSGIIPGTTYIIEFYQANATNLLIPQLREEAYGSWEVQFGDETKTSFPMAPNSSNITWQRASLEFVANSSSEQIEFIAHSSAFDINNSYPVYVLIDGIRIYPKPISSTDTCTDINTQGFCTLGDNELTFADVVSPVSGTTNWYSEQVGGVLYNQTQSLYSLSNFIIWADNGEGDRVPVEIVFDLGAPKGNTNQFFDIQDVPTVENLIAEGENVTWYDSEDGTTSLNKDTILIDGKTYYAAQGNNPCRLQVTVKIGISNPKGDGYQVFCSNNNPTIADIVMETTNPEYTIAWYADETTTESLDTNTLLSNNATYYAVQTNGVEQSAVRVPVRIKIIDVTALYKRYDRDILVPENSVIGLLTKFYGYSEDTVWYTSEFGNETFREGTKLEKGITYYARIGQGLCSASAILAVTVQIDDVEEPERISCIKFIPKPGSKYVISAWVRESTKIGKDPVTLQFDDVKYQFINLIGQLKDKVLNKTSIPLVYVPKNDVLFDGDVEGLLPFVKGNTDRNLTVYDFSLIKEEVNGLERSIGFSFSLAKGGPEFRYITPKVALKVNGIGFKIKRKFHLPILFEDTPKDHISINFNDVEIRNGNFYIVSEFFFNSNNNKNPFLVREYENQVSKPTISGFEASPQVFTNFEDTDQVALEYVNSSIDLSYLDINGNTIILTNDQAVFNPQGSVIDGWQRVSSSFTIPSNAASMTITLRNSATENSNGIAYFDDVRIYPFNGNMKTFVYDPVTQWLRAELDENNYATFYEYDKEGGLIRVKKETEEGVYTIQETRSGTSKKNSTR